MANLLGEYEPFPFEVEPAMINLFNGMSLVMITFPFAPTAMIFLPFAIYISVKVEVYCMINYNQKPERTWKAHQSGVIFTSFYLTTLVVIGLPISIYFLSTENFPKNCDIQDNAAKLCKPSTYINGTCDLDSDSVYYEFYKQDSSFEYPLDFCGGDKSCGPFAEFPQNLKPFKDKVFELTALGTIWELLFDYSYIPWITIAVMLVSKWRSRNTRETLRESEAAKERVLSVQVESLEAEKKRQDKLILRLKSQQAASEAAAELRNMQSPRA